MKERSPSLKEDGTGGCTLALYLFLFCRSEELCTCVCLSLAQAPSFVETGGRAIKRLNTRCLPLRSARSLALLLLLQPTAYASHREREKRMEGENLALSCLEASMFSPSLVCMKVCVCARMCVSVCMCVCVFAHGSRSHNATTLASTT